MYRRTPRPTYVYYSTPHHLFRGNQDKDGVGVLRTKQSRTEREVFSATTILDGEPWTLPILLIGCVVRTSGVGVGNIRTSRSTPSWVW